MLQSGGQNFICKASQTPVGIIQKREATFQNLLIHGQWRLTKRFKNNSCWVCKTFKQLNMEHAACDAWSAVLVRNCQPSIQTPHDKHARPFNHRWTAPDRWSYVTKPQRCWGDVADSEESLPKLLLFWTHHFTAVQLQFILFEHCLHHKVIWIVHMYLLNITSNCQKWCWEIVVKICFYKGQKSSNIT